LAPLRQLYSNQSQLFGEAFEGDGIVINSPIINGLPTQEAKDKITATLDREGTGHRTVNYKLRDWLFSRQRYWGEPFPIVLDEEGHPYALRKINFRWCCRKWRISNRRARPSRRWSKAKDWVKVTIDGKNYTRETNVMPNGREAAGITALHRPHNDKRFVDPAKEKYWMPVDLYVGGVEHAVLHLLYSRFWHKVLFDLGHVTTPEPFQRLVNQGLILGEMQLHVFALPNGRQVSATELRDVGEEATGQGVRVVGYHKQTGEQAIAGASTRARWRRCRRATGSGPTRPFASTRAASR